MRLGIDASNLRRGGGITHLVEMLRAADPAASGFDAVLVWGEDATLAQLEDRLWLLKRPVAAFGDNFVRRALWQRRQLGRLAREENCDLLFIPGGSFATSFRPVVVMSRNMLPFEWRELLRFGVSLQSVRLLLLRWSQSRSFQRADGVVFLTRYAQEAVLRVTGQIRGALAKIPHGVDVRFRNAPRPARALEECSDAQPLQLLYVSIIDVYKHQCRVVEAVAQLRRRGYPVRLDLVGPAYAPALRLLRRTLARVDPQGCAIRYLGAVRYAQLHACYGGADIAVFASSCENMPNILLEAMASGLPIACSNRGPMPEILGGAGRYFDPEDAESIAAAFVELIQSPTLRAHLAGEAFARAQDFSWALCAAQTFDFLARIASSHLAQGAPRRLTADAGRSQSFGPGR